MSDWPRNRNGDSDAYGNGMENSGNAELAAVGRAVRAVYVEEPAPEVAGAHIAAILAEAERVAAAGADRAAAPSASRPRMLVFRLAAVIASAFVASAGLAIAGVRPPEPVSDLFEGLGFEVPGSDQSAGAPGAGKGDPATSQGADHGRAPDAGEAEIPESEAQGADASNRGDERSSQGNEASSEGLATAQEAEGGGAPPSEPGRSEDHPNAPAGASAPEQPAGAGAPEQGQAGEGEPAETSSDGDGDAPQTLADPTTPPAGAAAPGLAVSQEKRPVEDPGKPAEPEPAE